jgi:phosphoribosylanthranilate isomerase
MSSRTLRTRIKICGLKTVGDALCAARSGADTLGLVFHPRSPRCIGIERAIEIRDALPAFVGITALFMDDPASRVAEVVENLAPDCLQFHGAESPRFCEQWGRPYIKALPMGELAGEEEILAHARRHGAARGFLMDSHAAGRQGGSGDTFDWSRIPSDFPHPLILAGGLNPQNVARAITPVRPWAVDVSSGVERDKGVKDAVLIQHFCQEVFRADHPC